MTHDGMTLPGVPEPAYLDMPLGQFLTVLASGTPAPGGGAAAALSVALGASLCAMTARLSARRLDNAVTSQLTTDGERILRSAASLMQADGEAYSRVISAMRKSTGADPAARERAVAAALSDAADVPMQIVELAAEAAGLASRLAADGNPALRGDAIAAALLAGAAARSAATMVSINLAGTPDDERHARADSLVADAGRSAGAAARAHSAAIQAPNSMEPSAGSDRRRS